MKKNFIVSVLFLLMPSTLFASEQDIRSQCFSTLKNNLSEVTIFSDPLKELQKMSYVDLEPKFSENYKNLESFGIQIDRGDLEMRLYSFGRQTGYIHPPKLPLPSTQKSDTWKEPAKEFIVAEEFVKDPVGNSHFLDCAFFVISSYDLMSVTSDKYLYDGEMISLTKIAKDGSYKAWYSSNESFDYTDKPFVEWQRLFIYPKLTQNEYFNKYDIAEVLPAHIVDSFSILNFIKDKVLIKDYAPGSVKTSYAVDGKDNNLVIIETPSELIPPTPLGEDEFSRSFSLSAYYQAIENRFPKFAERLSIHGTLKYDTFKRLFMLKDSNKEVATLLGTLSDYREVARYSLDKKNKAKEGITISDPEKDKLLQDINNGEVTASELLENTKASSTASIIVDSFVASGVAVVVVVLIALTALFFRRNKTTQI